jgi:hypothetical protein
MKVEKVEGVSLKKGAMTKPPTCLAGSLPRLLKFSEIVDKACFEVKAFVIETHE